MLTKTKSVAGYIGIAALIAAGFTACMDSNDYKKNKDGRIEKAPDESNANSDAQVSDNTSNKDNGATAGKAGNNNATEKNATAKARKMRMSVDMSPETGERKMSVDASGVYLYPDRMPQFPGGNDALVSYVENNTNYRESAINNETEGTVRVSFIVDENGKVSSPVVVGSKVGSGLDEEAISVVKSMPDWKPGTVKGKKVKTRLSLPITFKLVEL